MGTLPMQLPKSDPTADSQSISNGKAQSSQETKNAKGISFQKMSVPKGGGAFKGIGEKFEMNLFSGGGTLAIPIETAPCRGGGLSLSLSYQTSGGNGLFGMGFSLNLPTVSRMTKKHIPLYDDDDDQFLMSGEGELVLLKKEADGHGNTVRTYRCRYESNFSKIEYIHGNDVSCWRVLDRNNTKYEFGTTKDSIVGNPDKPEQIFMWKQSFLEDEKGNKTYYQYDPTHHHINSIHYGYAKPDSSPADFLFSVQFQYKGRRDAFREFNSGFEIQTDCLCDYILLSSHFQGKDTLIRKTSFSYCEDRISRMEKISVTGYKTDALGNPISQQMPDVCFSYTAFQPEKGDYHPLKIENQLPFTLGKAGFLPVDLYGEGAAGLLYASNNTALYCSPLGNYQYAAPKELKNFPIYRDLSQTELSLTSLEANGKYDLVVRTPSISGYYSLKDSEWENFQPFPAQINEQFSTHMESADLQGDRQNHLLLTNRTQLRYYPSLKKQGAGPPVEQSLPEGFPFTSEGSKTELSCFLGLFGDGLSHRVHIKNGSVECYPNLGYGKFGNKIVIENAPRFPDGLDVARLFFADIDGSGTTDFIYACSDHVLIYWNEGGLRFSEPTTIPLPDNMCFTSQDNLSFADINGDGTCCMIFSHFDKESKHYCYDFTKGQKPYMLCRMENNTGMCTKLEYCSSVKQYLQDKTANPWKIRPPFPVQLIAKKIIEDCLSKNVMESTYRYRDGLYDFEENEFSGFGQITQIDSQKNQIANYKMESVITKHYFYVGKDAAPQFWSGDTASDLLPVFDGDFLPTEADKSLWGKPVRTEIFQSGTPDPFSVNQTSYQVVELMKPQEKKHGSYFTYAQQQLEAVYDGQADDPAMHHTFQLEVDEFGNSLHSCEIAYPRRQDTSFPAPIQMAQKALHVTAAINHCCNQTGEPRHLGVPTEAMQYDFSGLACTALFTRETLLSELNEGMKELIPFGVPFEPGKKQACLKSRKKSFYWDTDQKTALPFGQVGGVILPHHTEEAVFPVAFSPITERLEEQQLIKDCGYRKQDGYWWCWGSVTSYDKDAFYLPVRQEHPTLFQKAEMEYDTCKLFPVVWKEYYSATQYNTVQAAIDYTSLNIRQITDENGTVTQVLYDALGQPVVTTSYGSLDGVREGDLDVETYQWQQENFDALMEHPEQYLQGMSTYEFRDLLAYQQRKQPVCTVSLARSLPVSTAPQSDIRCKVSYWDSLGHPLKEKQKADAGLWNVNGRVVYNGYGKALLTYPAYLSKCPRFEYADIPTPPVRNHYDCLQRITRIETPDSGIGENVYWYYHTDLALHTWEAVQHDAESTLEQSEYYKKFLEAYPPSPTPEQADKKAALEKSLQWKGKAAVQIFDSRHNKIADLLPEADGAYVFYEYDSNNRLTAISDARMQQTGKHNIKNRYNMLGESVSTISCDKGTAIVVSNACKNPVHLWTGSTHKKLLYDGLQRPIEIQVEGLGTVERITYGESEQNAKVKNLIGRAYKHYDQAGVETLESYHYQGSLHAKSRQLCKAAGETVDWSGSVALENEEYREQVEYDSAGNVTELTAPDQSVQIQTYGLQGELKSVSLRTGSNTTEMVSLIEYNADGNRTKIIYGNGVQTNYQYSASTTLLENTRSFKKDGTVLQQLHYTYSPVGSLSVTRDMLSAAAVTHQQVTAPVFSYWYDVYGRLTKATGRELSGNGNDMGSMVSYTQSYAYDLSGNLTNIQHQSPAGNFSTSMRIAQDSNRMTAQEHAGQPTGAMQEIQYDECGNIKNLDHLRRMDWNFDGRLLRAAIIERQEEPNDEELYTYASSGSRLRKVTKRLVDGAVEIKEKVTIGQYSVERTTLNGTPTKKRSSLRVNAGETPFATLHRFLEGNQAGTSLLLYHLESHLNSVGVDLNDAAEVVRSEEFYPFGGTAFLKTDKQEVPEKEYRFCNKERDATGLYYFEARYYASAFCRMISADDVAFIDPENWLSLNQYAYCQNNPVSFTDPTGNCPDPPKNNHPKEEKKADAKPYQGISLVGLDLPPADTDSQKNKQDLYGKMILSANPKCSVTLHDQPFPIFMQPMQPTKVVQAMHAMQRQVSIETAIESSWAPQALQVATLLKNEKGQAFTLLSTMLYSHIKDHISPVNCGLHDKNKPVGVFPNLDIATYVLYMGVTEFKNVALGQQSNFVKVRFIDPDHGKKIVFETQFPYSIGYSGINDGTHLRNLQKADRSMNTLTRIYGGNHDNEFKITFNIRGEQRVRYYAPVTLYPIP